MVGVFVAVEVALRIGWGFGKMLLFQEDKELEYIAKPNQRLTRFGNENIYNEYAMRSLPITKDDDCVVLGFGDSVLNGGTLTDQDSLATTLVENELREMGKEIRFLNISAASWGPDNCAAYIKKYGTFNARMIILFVSSHDARDNMTFEKTVGVHESYPDKQYPLAVLEVLDRYLVPRLINVLKKNDDAANLRINTAAAEFNSGFEFFKSYAEQNKIPFVVCLHAETDEVRQKNFNDQGTEILQYCATNNIKVISGLQIGEQLSDFRDYIHINEGGQKRWAKVLLKEIQETVGTCP